MSVAALPSITADPPGGLHAMRIYVDMVGDLFHAGHASFCQRARAKGQELLLASSDGGGDGTVTLVVGITNDAICASYKRVPVMTNAERCACARACRYVDEVIEEVPLVTTRAFMEKHRLDYLVHGDDYTPAKVNLYYSEVVALDRYRTVPYTPGISTSDLLRRAADRGRQGGGGGGGGGASDGALLSLQMIAVASAAAVAGFVLGATWRRQQQ